MTIRDALLALAACCTLLTGCTGTEQTPTGNNTPVAMEERLRGAWQLARTEVDPDPAGMPRIIEDYPARLQFSADTMCSLLFTAKGDSVENGPYRVDADGRGTAMLAVNGRERGRVRVTADSLYIERGDHTTGVYSRFTLTPVCETAGDASIINLAVVDVFNDPYELLSASLEGDVLCATVRYSGGCNDHDWHLLVNEAIMESHPPQVAVLLTHNAHNDACDALLTRAVGFNMAPVKEHFRRVTGQQSGTILLQINGYGVTQTVECDF